MKSNDIFSRILISIVILFINYTNAFNIFNFQCFVDIITKNGGHSITVGNLISKEFLLISADTVYVDDLKSLIITCCDKNSFLIKPQRDNIIIHTDYEKGKGPNNLALIKIPQSKLKAECIKPIALPCPVPDEYLEAKESMSTNFNTFEKDIPKELPGLEKIFVQIIDNKKCQKEFLFKYDMNEMNICILPQFKQTECYPNHPIVVKNCDNKNTLAGITIQAHPSCAGPIAAINLSKYFDWINRVTKGKISQCSQIDCDDLHLEVAYELGFNDAMHYFIIMC